MSGFRLKSAFWTYYLSTMGPHRGRPYYHPNGGFLGLRDFLNHRHRKTTRSGQLRKHLFITTGESGKLKKVFSQVGDGQFGFQ